MKVSTCFGGTKVYASISIAKVAALLNRSFGWGIESSGASIGADRELAYLKYLNGKNISQKMVRDALAIADVDEMFRVYLTGEGGPSLNSLEYHTAYWIADQVAQWVVKPVEECLTFVPNIFADLEV
jgi:hypothetical protein